MMAIELFQIEWTNLYPFETALRQPEAMESGVYALYKSTGKTKKLFYIGKSKEFSSRFSSHKRNSFHMLNETERKRCFVSFGLISCFERSRLSTGATNPQLKNIENFLITKLQPIGCGDSTKKRYTGDYSMIIANTGKVTKPFKSPELLDIIGRLLATS